MSSAFKTQIQIFVKHNMFDKDLNLTYIIG